MLTSASVESAADWLLQGWLRCTAMLCLVLYCCTVILYCCARLFQGRAATWIGRRLALPLPTHTSGGATKAATV